MANRYKDQYGANEIPMEAADSGFLGVNTQLDPGLLKTGAAYRDVNQMLAGPGIAAHAVNMRFSKGVAETRQGTIAPVWCNPRMTGLRDSARIALQPPDYEVPGDWTPFVPGFPGTGFDATKDWVIVHGPMPAGLTNMCCARIADTNFGPSIIYRWRSVHTYTVNSNTFKIEVRASATQCQVYSYNIATTMLSLLKTCEAGTGSFEPWKAVWTGGWTLLVQPYAEAWTERILAAAPFSDPDGEEWLVLAFPSRVVRVRQGEPPREIPLPSGLTLAEPVRLLQTFDSMVMLRGFSLPPLAWDGTDGEGFKGIPDASPDGSYTASIPPARTGAVMNNRLFLPFDRDTVAVSDILDFTRYDAELNAFRINTGEDDAITAVFPFRRTNLLVFKEFSTHVITDVAGDLSNVGAEIINSEIGCPAPDSIAAVGGDVFFLGQNGVYRVSEVVEQSMQVQESPVSEPIEPLIRRINWNYVHLATAVVMGDYYRLAVPIDGATRNNAVLVFDTVRGQWQGYDVYPTLWRPDIFTKSKHDGRRRAMAIDREKAMVVILDVGPTDVQTLETALTTAWSRQFGEVPIYTELRTRGYILLDDGPKRIRHGTVTLETWNPRFTISTVTEGVNEESAVMTDRTRDRTKWHLHGKADYDPTNANHDHAAPKRRDYSVILPADGIELDTGIRLQLGQESIEQFPIRQLGRWLALKITNTQGRIAIKAAGVDGQNIRNSSRIFA
jgi:hypothetical protein